MSIRALFCAGGAVLAGSMTIAAQTSCYGANCPPPEFGSVGDGSFFDTYQGYWPMDLYQAQTQWNLTQTEAFESRQECVEACRDDYIADLQLCRDTHGEPVDDEDVAISQSRINCADAMRQREIQCISPAQLLNCPD